MSDHLRYKGLIVFAAPRTGSTHVVEMLTEVLAKKYPLEKFKNLYEVFESSSAFTPEWDPITIDRYEWITRPYINGVLHQRIAQLAKSKIFPVFKIFMQDFEGRNYDLYDRHFGSDVYNKIILNRYDTRAQVISYVLSKHTNIWHVRDDASMDKYINAVSQQFEVDLAHVHYIGRNIINLYAWQLFNHSMPCIWYEDLPDIEIPELGISYADLQSYQSQQKKMNSRHADLLHRCASNANDVICEIDKLERSISKVRDIVRKRNATP